MRSSAYNRCSRITGAPCRVKQELHHKTLLHARVKPVLLFKNWFSSMGYVLLCYYEFSHLIVEDENLDIFDRTLAIRSFIQRWRLWARIHGAVISMYNELQFNGIHCIKTYLLFSLEYLSLSHIQILEREAGVVRSTAVKGSMCNKTAWALLRLICLSQCASWMRGYNQTYTFCPLMLSTAPNSNSTMQSAQNLALCFTKLLWHYEMLKELAEKQREISLEIWPSKKLCNFKQSTDGNVNWLTKISKRTMFHSSLKCALCSVTSAKWCDSFEIPIHGRLRRCTMTLHNEQIDDA